MDHKDLVMRKQQLLYRLSCLPEKIVSAHEIDNLAEFVLYELCHPECLNLGKAAFFVDNPDFDCLRGIAGISTDDHVHALDNQDVWQIHDTFSKTMRDSQFNRSVRAVSCPSMAKSGLPIEEEVENIVKLLPLKNHAWRSFKTKHGNRGILIFEQKANEETQMVSDHIVSGASLLAFCPIF